MSFRNDIQGLRAIAVGAVLLYHAGLPFVDGGFVGVDVFFVISGFLITGLLLKEVQSTGRIRLGDFYAKRARRILPAATVVLGATVILTLVFLPTIRWESIGLETIASALYIVNWVFAVDTDYLNAEVAASPLQHFWTLAVEEQFYIVWPIVLIAMIAVSGHFASSRHKGTVARGIMPWARIGVLLVIVPSLIWSIYYTEANPAAAYFVTTTRLWELAIGAAVATFAVHLERIPDRFGYVLGWAGLAAIIVASVSYSGSVAFPGIAALLPTLGAAAVIVGGMRGRASRGVGRLLSLKPMVWIGGISYSLYLWHWPLIVVGTYLLGDDMRIRHGVLIVVLSVLPAWLSYRFIEDPFRNWPRLKASVGRSLRAGASLMVVTALLGAVMVMTPRMAAEGESTAVTEPLGAEALTDDFSQDRVATFTDAGAPVDIVEGGFLPAAIDARGDNPRVYENGCFLDAEEDEAQVDGCVFGDPDSDTHIVLVGDSHSANWVEPLIRVAEKHGWSLRFTGKSGCAFAANPQARDSREYASCTRWNQATMSDLEAERPDLVITSNSDSPRYMWRDGEPLTLDESGEYFVSGLAETWSDLNDVGVPVMVIQDTPQMESDVPECVSANPDRLALCATPRSSAIDDVVVIEELAAEGLEQVEIVNMNNWLCPDFESCPPVIGNALVWRDAHHLTATFSVTLAEPLEAAMRKLEIIDPGELFD